MKHNLKITLILVSIFLLAQVVGIIIIKNYHYFTPEGEIEYKDLPLNIERPEVEEKVSAIYITVGILLGTGLLLLLIKFRKKNITRLWFMLAIFIGLSVAFSAFIDQRIAVALAIIISIWKVFYPNMYVNNFAEIFVYGGIAAIFHEMLSIFSVVILLVLISVYDMVAVWKIKHMITLAKFQTENKMFAGAMIPYALPEKPPVKKAKATAKSKKLIKSKKIALPQMVKVKTAVLGGGDMAFPLLFAGAVLKTFGLALAFIPIITSTVALATLLIKAEKDKFYPAMPFLAAGCFVGLGLVYIVNII